MHSRRSLKYLPSASRYLSPSALFGPSHVFDLHVRGTSPIRGESYWVEGLALGPTFCSQPSLPNEVCMDLRDPRFGLLQRFDAGMHGMRTQY
jgi:hypothetical protein